jgi:hypothetical protein
MVLIHDYETWFLTNNTAQKLQAFVNRCLHNILGMCRPQIIANQPRTGQSDINVEMKRKKFGQIRHSIRRSENRYCNIN